MTAGVVEGGQEDFPRARRDHLARFSPSHHRLAPHNDLGDLGQFQPNRDPNRFCFQLTKTTTSRSAANASCVLRELFLSRKHCVCCVCPFSIRLNSVSERPRSPQSFVLKSKEWSVPSCPYPVAPTQLPPPSCPHPVAPTQLPIAPVAPRVGGGDPHRGQELDWRLPFLARAFFAEGPANNHLPEA